jgi:hypothetical protein
MIPPAPSVTDTSVPSLRSTTTTPTWGTELMAAWGGQPVMQPAPAMGRLATTLTDSPVTPTIGATLVPFIVIDFTMDAATVSPELASRMTVQENVVVKGLQVLEESTWTVVLCWRDEEEPDKEIPSPATATITTIAIIAVVLLATLGFSAAFSESDAGAAGG